MIARTTSDKFQNEIIKIQFFASIEHVGGFPQDFGLLKGFHFRRLEPKCHKTRFRRFEQFERVGWFHKNRSFREAPIFPFLTFLLGR